MKLATVAVAVYVPSRESDRRVGVDGMVSKRFTCPVGGIGQMKDAGRLTAGYLTYSERVQCVASIALNATDLALRKALPDQNLMNVYGLSLIATGGGRRRAATGAGIRRGVATTHSAQNDTE